MFKRPNFKSLQPSLMIGNREQATLAAGKVRHKNADSTSTTSDYSKIASSLASGPARTSQDLDLDWSRFENHTFFDSAASKVNAAFVHIVNEFPFDGTKKELLT